MPATHAVLTEPSQEKPRHKNSVSRVLDQSLTLGDNSTIAYTDVTVCGHIVDICWAWACTTGSLDKSNETKERHGCYMSRFFLLESLPDYLCVRALFFAVAQPGRRIW